MSRVRKLTEKEVAFCECYVFEGLSATKAYQKVYGCAYNSASANSVKVMKKDAVREYIESLQKEAFKASCLTAEKVALKLSEIAFAEKGNEDYNTTAQLKALELLSTNTGLQKQHIEQEIKTNINITVEE